MELRRDMLLGVGAMLTLLLLVCFGAISLITRMSPAIEQVVQENDASLAATEEMLRVLVLSQNRPGDTQLRERFSRALDRARKSVTEEEEEAEIATIGAHGPRALDGDAQARSATVDALDRLAVINREAILRADVEVRRLGWAGAWSVALLGFIGFVAGLIVLRRVDSRILQPLALLHSTLTAAKQGDSLRRVHVPAVSSDVMFILQVVNELLDQSAFATSRSSLVQPSPVVADLRPALLHLLDDRVEPCAVVSADGTIEAADRDVLALLQGQDGDALADALREGAAGHIVAPVVDVARVGEGKLAICTLAPLGPKSSGLSESVEA
jgi:hypothetical protein